MRFIRTNQAAFEALDMAIEALSQESSEDVISRQAAIDICANAIDLWHGQLGEGALVAVQDKISGLPSAQLNLSEAYSKAVFTWLMDYQIRAAELKGRYTPYEVLSWVANDWRKEHEGSD